MRVKATGATYGQVVDHDHFVAAGEESISEMGADETSAAGHENSHDPRA